MSGMIRYAIRVLLMTTLPAAADLVKGRPLRLIVPAPAGGAPSVVGRVLAEQMGPALGHALVVDERPGAAGIIARALWHRPYPMAIPSCSRRRPSWPSRRTSSGPATIRSARSLRSA